MVINRIRPAHRRGAAALGAAGLVATALLGGNVASSLVPAAPEPAAAVNSTALPLLPSPEAGRPKTLTPPVNLVDQAVPGTVPPDALRGSPERRLIAVYRLLASGRYEPALQAAEALVRAYPNFRLAQLVQADLMVARFEPLQDFGAGARQGADTGERGELTTLRDEARLRLKALIQRPPEGAVPAEFLSLPPSVPFAIAVDTSAARLYLFENSPAGLRLVDDVYVSVGKQGVDKSVEGDQRTPLGVYFTTDRLDPRSLQERFGSGALPLNYPNAYDKLKGRTGSGILLHGVTASTYSRPPLDSDGCVAMANEDLTRLASRLPQRDTPVVITRQIRWVEPAKRATPEGFQQTFAQWQQARLRADLAQMRELYEQSGPQDGGAEQRFRAKVASAPEGFGEVSVLTWHDDEGKLVVTFKEVGSGPKGRDRLMRQYWRETRSGWRIVAEGPVR
ncbi:L,D-transpeptidase family protein [Ideonella sp. 4Y16]|uniref:L,D-transpeptidase family protein n=1 Tax=Ideonella alba TaxID=2824118 RepID=A0A940YCY5_9BURK|nr:L,D-transpeptidase family protein [Ideonella alba]MBQ0930836.1 L,D-transpeptidase family protein [Ideonella alba]MBQ0944951.1 L,D-transpeptidase family protein [Ideonella alba]